MRAPSDMPRPARRRRGLSGRGRIVLVVVAVALFVLITSLRTIAGFYTDYLWFDSLGQGSVFTGVVGAKVALAAIFTGVFFVILFANLLIADRIAPRFRPAGPEEDLIERYHELVGSRTGLVRVGVAVLFAVITGIGASSHWHEWILFTNRVDFGRDDPLFGTDIGFYVFQLPFLRFVTGWLFAALVIVLIITAVAHYLNGGIRVNNPLQRVTPQVKAHVSVLLGALALVKAAGYWLQQYGLTTSTRGTVDGATYTDVNVQLPAIRLLLLISLFAFLLFIVNIWRRGWVLPVLAVGLWAFVAMIAGGIVPALVQKFRVEPSESSKERVYIDRNIEATREGMGLADVEVAPFVPPGERDLGDLTDEDLAANADTINNIRLWDPNPLILGQTYAQLQEVRGFYQIRDVDVDRYELDGRTRQVMISTRELDTGNVPQSSWEARHLAFTHGYGIVMAPANFKDSEDQPDLRISDIPVNNDTEIPIEQPSIYIGEDQGGYVIVNTKRQEIDYQDEAGENVFTEYEGDDGVAIGTWTRRLAFALRFGDFNPLFSGNLQSGSRVLLIRDVRDRVKTLAPFLEFDSDPYPVLIAGRIVWVVDGYTTTDQYPYAQYAITRGLPEQSDLGGRYNYVRNSVKATVDAYDGTVTLYVVDSEDPIAAAYQKAFPSLFADEDPPDDLVEHFRYPEDLFRVQTTMWGRYHQRDPDTFYNNNDGWVIAQDPGLGRLEVTQTATTVTPPVRVEAVTSNPIAPVYSLVQLPGDEQQTFQLMRPFVPIPKSDDARQLLTGFMAASSEPDSYGQLRVFTMPSSNLPPGPALAAATMSSDPAVSELETLLGIREGGSELLTGNMLLVPIEDSLLYVRPVYVQAEQNRLPLLRKVIVEYKNDVSVADTLREALAGLEAFEEIPPSIEEDVVDDEPGPPPDDGEPAPPAEEETVAELLAQAEELFAEVDTALREGDLAAYQRAVDEARELVRRALEESGGTVPPESSQTATTTTTTTA